MKWGTEFNKTNLEEEWEEAVFENKDTGQLCQASRAGPASSPT
jgi:hypothetical protein